MINNNLSVKNRIINILVALFALLYLVPFYFLIVNSFKTYAEIITNTSALPKHFNFNNFIKAFKAMEYIRVFMNSFIITLISNLGLVVISSMAAYRLVRKKTWINQIIFLILVASMVIPFQTIMIPLVQVLKIVGFINKYHGIIVCYLGFGTAISIFLFHGFIKLIPFDIEEAALIDGCSVYGIFWRIVFPLLKPICVTVLVLNILWIWNDFLLPALVIMKKELQTIPLSINTLFATYAKQWDLAMAALVMSIIPLIIVFLFLQKHIIRGITEGAVKS